MGSELLLRSSASLPTRILASARLPQVPSFVQQPVRMILWSTLGPVPLVDRRWVRAFPSHRDRAPGAEYRPLWRQIPKTSAYSGAEYRPLWRQIPKTSACLQGFLNYSVINSEDFGVLPKTSACLQGFLNYSVINSIIYPVCSLSKI